MMDDDDDDDNDNDDDDVVVIYNLFIIDISHLYTGIWNLLSYPRNSFEHCSRPDRHKPTHHSGTVVESAAVWR